MTLSKIAAPLIALVLLAAVDARAADSTPRDIFRAGVTALQRGAYSEAIDHFELLADRGFVHPDASFNRAASYIARARTPGARPGDLGRAAAALAETLALRPGDDEADAALERVRSEIARRRAREGQKPIVVRPSLTRAVVGLVSVDAWAISALAGSVLTALGLTVRWLAGSPPARLGAAIVASVGALLLAVCGSLAAAAHHLRVTSDPAVVVVDEARLLDERGVPVQQKDGVPEHVAIPEGAGIFVLESRGALSRVEWGDIRGWIGTAQLRVLPER